MNLQKVRQALIQNDFIIFASDYGKKVVAESWTKRLSKQVKQASEFKDFQNYNFDGLIKGKVKLIQLTLHIFQID